MTSPITKHLNKRMSQRRGLKLNRKARVELLKWIQVGKATKIDDSRTHKYRVILSVPIFLSRTLCELNPDIKFGDRVVAVYDAKLRRIITVYNTSVL